MSTEKNQLRGDPPDKGISPRQITRNSMSDGRSTDLLRRNFCSGILIGSAGLVISAKVPEIVPSRQAYQEVFYPPMRIEGAEALMPGSSLYFTYPRHSAPAVLLRNESGEYYAYSQKCPHRGCSVYFDRARRCLECPCHKGAFDTQTGFVLYGPPRQPLDQIILQVRAGGQIWAVGRGIGRDQNVSS